MDTTILQTIATRIKHASATNSKEIRLSIHEANELLAVIAYVSAQESEDLKVAIQDFLDQLTKIQPQIIHVSGGTF
jgi:hypothetical protein